MSEDTGGDDGRDEAREELLHYLQAAREAVVWKLEGLSEYEVRRPLTRTGTNLLGLVKHLAGVELGYFGECLGRPHGLDLEWYEEDAEDNADMWATAQESREEVVDLYREAWRRTDAVVRELGLEATGHVPWWGEHSHPSLRLLLVHVVAETHRHAGHADIVRELLDGEAGHRRAVSNLPEHDEQWWVDHRARLESAAREAGGLEPAQT
jgi:uncharacterized damage-inducible protein DinB